MNIKAGIQQKQIVSMVCTVESEFACNNLGNKAWIFKKEAIMSDKRDNNKSHWTKLSKYFILRKNTT